MSELEQIYEDKKCWTYFTAEEDETIGVFRRCECGKYLTTGQLLINGAGEIKLQGWICKRHGEREPYFDRDIQPEFGQ